MNKWTIKKTANETEILNNIKDIKSLMTVLINGNYIRNTDSVLNDFDAYMALKNVDNLINQDKDIDYIINYINNLDINIKWLEELRKEKIQYVKDMYNPSFGEE